MSCKTVTVVSILARQLGRHPSLSLTPGHILFSVLAPASPDQSPVCGGVVEPGMALVVFITDSVVSVSHCTSVTPTTGHVNLDHHHTTYTLKAGAGQL